MQSKFELKKSALVYLVGIPIFVLIKIYLGYNNFQIGSNYLKRNVQHQIKLDFEGKHMRLIDKNISFDIYFHSFKFCGKDSLISELGEIIAPNDVRTKLFVTKDKNSNLFRTMINDTCYEFQIDPQSGFYGDIFGVGK